MFKGLGVRDCSCCSPCPALHTRVNEYCPAHLCQCVCCSVLQCAVCACACVAVCGKSILARVFQGPSLGPVPVCHCNILQHTATPHRLLENWYTRPWVHQALQQNSTHCNTSVPVDVSIGPSVFTFKYVYT